MNPVGSSGSTLKPRTAAHAEELFAVLSDPALYQFLDEEPPASVEALRQKLARSESRKSPDGSEHWLNWVVRDEFQQVVGYVQATIHANSDANVAYVIGTAHWGRGLAYRAVEQMLRIAVAEFGAKRFLLRSERENHRSVRLAERLRFVPASAELSASKGVIENEILLQRVP